MSIARVKASSLTQGLPKQKTLLAGNSTILPGSYESIATVDVGAGGSASVTFSSIPNTYTHLQVRGIARTSTTADYSNYLRFNGVTASSYSYHFLQGNGTSASANYTLNDTSISQGQWLPLSNQTAGAFGTFVLDILDYANTSKNKTTRTLCGFDVNGGGFAILSSGLFNNTSAISSITLFPSASGSYPQYSSFALYGIK